MFPVSGWAREYPGCGDHQILVAPNSLAVCSCHWFFLAIDRSHWRMLQYALGALVSQLGFAFHPGRTVGRKTRWYPTHHGNECTCSDRCEYQT